MGWRCNRVERNFSDAERIAWEYVLPHQHIPILDQEIDEANKLSEFLKKAFSSQALKAAVARLDIGRYCVLCGVPLRNESKSEVVNFGPYHEGHCLDCNRKLNVGGKNEDGCSCGAVIGDGERCICK